MTRIIAGTAGGRRLQTPTGGATRPSSDRVREALFAALESAVGGLSGRRILDLFAGSGAVGLEALSRGAAEAVLVERDRRTAALIRTNADTLGLDGAHVVAAPAETYTASPPAEPFDVVFCDPPYAYGAEALNALVATVATPAWLGEGVIVVERAAREAAFGWPESVEPLRVRTYGDTALWYGRLWYGRCHA